jgi:hypothetical protein
MQVFVEIMCAASSPEALPVEVFGGGVERRGGVAAA